MDLSYILRGIAFGFSVAAPVGPIGILVIRRTLVEGRLMGFVSGLGAATTDAVYGAIAGFGLSLVSHLLLTNGLWIRLVGGLLLGYLGVVICTAEPAAQGTPARERGLLRAYASTAALTLTNPATILSFAAVFAALGMAGAPGRYDRAACLVAGVFLGSALWWFLLSGAISLIRRRFTAREMRWVNRASGVLILLFALGSLLSLAVSA